MMEKIAVAIDDAISPLRKEMTHEHISISIFSRMEDVPGIRLELYSDDLGRTNTGSAAPKDGERECQTKLSNRNARPDVKVFVSIKQSKRKISK